MNTLGLYIGIYLLALMAVVGNLVVIYYVIQRIKTFRAIMTRFVFVLHIAAMLQSIVALPYIYTGNLAICEMMGALHYYFGLVIIGVDICLTILYYNYLILAHPKLEGYLSHYAINSIVICSMISFLPLSTDSYGISNEVWCSLSYEHEEDNIWAFSIFYVWAMLACLFCVGFLGYIQHYATRFGEDMRWDLFFSAAGYVLITLISIIPRLLVRLIELMVDVSISFDAQFFIQGGIYLSSVLYVACFYRNRAIIKQYERAGQMNSIDLGTAHFSVQFLNSLVNGANRRDSQCSPKSSLLVNSALNDSKVSSDSLVDAVTAATAAAAAGEGDHNSMRSKGSGSSHSNNRATLSIITNPMSLSSFGSDCRSHGNRKLSKDDYDVL